MICRVARKLIPEAGNGSLSKEKSLGLERHLDLCRNCRMEANAYRAAMEAMKDRETDIGLDFTEAEWAAAIRGAVTQGAPGKNRRAAAPALRPVFAYGLAVLLAGATVFFGIRRFPWLIPSIETRPAGTLSASAETGAGQPEIIRPIDPVIDPAVLFVQAKIGASPEQAAGDVPTLTWISQETGLKIVWFVNDRIKMED
ncbi:MAG: zf-HC2 domain-containing protein [Candidatus Aminicenantes bacterium]|nr:zf-HC2 domain-containing protein [Candidatus Aminicenantes bacterium]